MDRLGYGNAGESGVTVPTGDDVEQFAALLRRLKDRTDRSYGSLARRLSMNTSTLHRYCAGEAVPQDYAPVERLAAFCGATAEERLELHRLWLLAIAARQRPRAGEEEAEPAAAEGVRTARPDDRTAQGADGDKDGTDGGTTTGASPHPDAGVPGTGPLPPGAPGPGGSGPTAGRAAARPAGRPWYRRRRTAVGAAAAAALLAALGSLPALSADRSHDNVAKAPGRSRTTGTGAPDSPGPKGGPSADKKNGTSAGASVPAGVPLAWTADSQIWEGGCGHDYVIGKEPPQVPPPPVQQDAEAWAATQEAVPGRQTRVQVSVQGKSSTAVVLQALRVRVVSRGTPVTGNVYAMGQGCGGDLAPREFSVNLDADRPIVRARSGGDTEVPLPVVRFPYRVSAEDPEVLLVTATTETYDCMWYLELDWSSQGRTGTVRIDDHGRPFRTSGIKGLPHYWYGTDDDGLRQWVPLDS
ncbi:helix-turn-helix domain-containing protein [Streptomyces sp. NPDC093094]|uniref:helix-turn-helix domain-containing protein n=1 Tax=Streptomyces sp. NPDC093094 TaxID=3366026 RepID=UPI0037F8AD64